MAQCKIHTFSEGGTAVGFGALAGSRLDRAAQIEQRDEGQAATIAAMEPDGGSSGHGP